MANATISSQTMEKIREKAESNTPLLDPTPEKQQAYDAYQKQYMQKVQDKAYAGEQLQRPNAWKDEIYQNAQMQQYNQQLAQQQQQYNPQNIMQNQQSVSGDRLAQLEALLKQGANSTYESQKAQLDATLNQQLLDLQQSLEEAVANGEISIRDAHAAFEENKAEIQKQAYQNSELTALHSQDRGIQNSQQMIGLMQGDAARESSMLNKNMTERDRRVADVKDRLNMIKNQTSQQMTAAKAQHGYGLAGARGQADAQMYQNMFNLGLDSYKLDREQQFNLDQMGLQNVYQQQAMKQQQMYALQNMSSQQKYQLEQMATQLGYDLKKMDVGQAYQLQQMAQAFGYDLSKMSVQQQYALQQMAQSHGYDLDKMQAGFGYDSALQGMQQSWQSGENALNREHDFYMQENRFAHDMNMLGAKQQAEVQSLEAAMDAELRSYQPGTKEYQLRQNQLQSSIDAIYFENHAKVMSDVMGKSFADFVGNPPTLPKNPTKEQYEKYSRQVDAYNTKLESYFNNPSNIDLFFSKLDKAPYSSKVKTNYGQVLTNGAAAGSAKDKLHQNAQNGDTLHGAFMEGLKKLFGGKSNDTP